MPTMPFPPATPARRDPDVLVIGGGIVGLFCAYHLRLAGVHVTVVERGPVGGPLSCSYGNTGFVGTHGAAPLAEPGVPAQGLRWLLDPESPFHLRPRWDAELLRWLWTFRRACNERDARAAFGVLIDMKKRSLDILRGLCASGDLAPAFREQGMVLAFKTAQGLEKASRAVPQAVAGGVPLRVLEPAELRALEPEVEFDICGALYNEEGAYLRVPDFVVGFARTLRGMGVEIHEEAEVTGFERAGRRVARVRTTRGDFTPGEVVIAAGTWSAQCARELGVGLRLQPAKGYSVTVRAPRNAPRRPLMLGEGKIAIAPLGDRLRFGGVLELSGLDAAVPRRRVDGILRTVQAYLPGLERTETVETWSGFRPCTPDSIPFLGRADAYRNLSVACGHGHIGMGLAPAGGRLLAQIVTGERPDTDPWPFRLSRYGGRSSRRLRRRDAAVR
ncbi:FAD-binding oxidoreductase [Planomonospora sp. ID82291]|uniref:NAD(P)/FAD-dependent oxidoreductase n=1 Tax=Planomonospora sp. ID82291 TaxID=2738136 RepID=UPI0018C38EB2|nr:FAD-dependent oxidoreductase [Planomonospora sp. ID82291]MBG0818121.1 FAD-dependent oxidoreductase [Planomonospora sp. ID82291]